MPDRLDTGILVAGIAASLKGISDIIRALRERRELPLPPDIEAQLADVQEQLDRKTVELQACIDQKKGPANV